MEKIVLEINSVLLSEEGKKRYEARVLLNNEEVWKNSFEVTEEEKWEKIINRVSRAINYLK